MSLFKNCRVHSRPVLPHKSSNQIRSHQQLYMGPHIELEENRRFLNDEEQELKEKKEVYKKAKVKFLRQWRELTVFEESLKASFKYMNTFVMSNLEKNQRSIENIENYRKLSKEHEAAIKDLKKKVADVKMHKQEMDVQLKKFSIYENFLDQFFQQYKKDEGFANLETIIERYELYKGIKYQFATDRARVFDKLYGLLPPLTEFFTEKRNLLIGLHTKLATCRQQYKEATTKTQRLELALYKIKRQIEEKYSDVQITKMAIWNLYRIICKRTIDGVKIPVKIPQEDVPRQLVIIKSALRRLHKVANLLK